MSKADELFKELGYKKEEHNFKYGNVIEYDDGNRQIDFIFRDKEVKIWNIAMDMKELKAINEKCKELRVVR